MKAVTLIDCTLRDGGFINDWRFGNQAIKNIFGKLDKAGVDFIEIGYIRNDAPVDTDRTVFPHTLAVVEMLSSLERGNAKVSVLMDFGECSLENIHPREKTNIDLFRVTFKKHSISDVIPFLKEIHARGYDVAVQPVSVTSYSEDNMLQLIDRLNSLKLSSVAVVDTYGLMHWNETEKYFRLLDKNLAPGINLGYHAHNNFQMGYGNSLMLCTFPTERNIMIDASLYGMGKSAGNTNLELIAMHLNRTRNANYDLVSLIEGIDSEITKLRPEAPWGYSLKYYFAALHACQPNYADFVLERFPISVANEILAKMDTEKKLVFDKDYVQAISQSYKVRRKSK